MWLWMEDMTASNSRLLYVMVGCDFNIVLITWWMTNTCAHSYLSDKWKTCRLSVKFMTNE